jgi:hypothetical protein
MQRRRLLGGLAMMPAVALVACGSDRESDTFVERTKVTRDHIGSVSKALDTVGGDLDNFKTMDWHEALSRLQTAVADLRSVVTHMENELGS